MCKNLIREVWQKRNLILKNDDMINGHAPFNPASDRTSMNSRFYLKLSLCPTRRQCGQ